MGGYTAEGDAPMHCKALSNAGKTSLNGMHGVLTLVPAVLSHGPCSNLNPCFPLLPAQPGQGVAMGVDCGGDSATHDKNRWECTPRKAPGTANNISLHGKLTHPSCTHNSKKAAQPKPSAFATICWRRHGVSTNHLLGSQLNFALALRASRDRR